MKINKLNRCSETGFFSKTRFLGLPNYLFNLSYRKQIALAEASHLA